MNQNTEQDILNYDDPQNKPKLNTGLNVLTILTFIGCGIFGLLTLFAPVLYNFGLNMMEKAKNSGKEFSTKELEEMSKNKAAIELSVQNMIPIMIIGIVGIVLCLIGAIWMRKLKKDGYWMYVAGELAPVIAGALIVGTTQFTSVWSVLGGVGIPIVFVVLYTMQRKYLTK